MKVSIITVAYNSASTIKDTIESVLNQTYKDIEYIIIDGNSKDNTLDIVRSFGAQVHVCISEPDKGIYDAMNKGISCASGDIIGFLNSDDFYADETIIEQVVSSFKEKDIDAVYGDLCYVNKENKNAIVRYWRSSAFRPNSFAKGWAPPHPTFFVRNHVYEKFGRFNLDLTLASDVELMFRFLEVHQIKTYYLSVVMVHMRLGGATNKSFFNMMKQNREILNAFSRHSQKHNLFGFLLKKLFSRGKQFFIRPS